ncbi:MAG: hypothetical protein HY209_04805 [Candidatus Omnitrophica bacterium]|nr:hypothetical protein [Candidatus Omnitrophota bacterium]
MKHSTEFLLFFVFLLMVMTPLYAGQLSLTTYYPAPTGNYNDMRVNNALRLESVTDCSSLNPSLTGQEVALMNFSGTLTICSSGGAVPLPLNLWIKNGSSIYTTYSTVGINNSNPTGALDVTGDIKASTDITSSGGNITASGASPNGNITATNNISATNSITAGTDITSSGGNIAASGASPNGNITANGAITAAGDIASSNGAITSLGNITTTGGNITATNNTAPATKGIITGNTVKASSGFILPKTNSPSCLTTDGCLWLTP